MSVVLAGASRRLSACARAGIACVLLARCAVGPDFHTPDPPKDAGYTPAKLPDVTTRTDTAGGEAQRFAIGRDIQFDWWTLFQSPALNRLVERAIAANPTIESAQAALRQAQETVYAQEGYFFPTVAANYVFEHQQLAGNLGGNSPGIQSNGRVIATKTRANGPPFNGPVVYNFHTAQLTVNYVPDVFGANRRSVENLAAQADVQRFALEATYVTLASNVVAAALQEASTREQIAAVKDIIDVNQKGLDILRGQFRYGYADRIDVAAQEAQLAAAVALLPPLDTQLEQTRDLIRMLAGNLPSQDVPETFRIADLRLPVEPPVSLPSRLIAQRPDIRAAEAQLRAANAQVGIAVAAMLPQITLSGSIGGAAGYLDQIFSPGGPFYTLVASGTQTLFDGLTLLHQKRAAEQGLIQAAANYRSAVLTGYQNVADTLHALFGDANALAAAVDAERAAKVTLDLTLAQKHFGFVDALALFAAEQAYQQAVINRIQAQATRFGDTAALYQALGGGWWNRDKITTADNSAVDNKAPVSARP